MVGSRPKVVVLGVAMIALAAWKQGKRGLLLAALLAGIALPAQAVEPSALTPLTKLQLSVVQWNPVLGQYQKLDAVSGEITVAPDRSITVPLVGKLPVENTSVEQLAAIIADRIKAKIGLVDLPEVTVDVAAYPPIYVVGDVTKAGEYPFRPDMTVLQALALGGGPTQASPEQGATRTKLLGDLQAGEGDILRTMAHIARYEAELSGAADIAFPPELSSAPKEGQIAQIIAQEQVVFHSRVEAAKRQEASFEELKALLLSEIDVLKQKGDNLETAITSKEKEYDGVKTLVDQGIATVTRRTDLETALTSLRADRLDNITATMRARQALSEAERNLAAVQDQQKTDASSQLQTEQAKLEQLRNSQATARLLLMGLPADTTSNPDGRQQLAYSIVRQSATGGVQQLNADETTTLSPGDVVKVTAIGKDEATANAAL